MTTSTPGLPDAWLEVAEYTLDASRVLYQADLFPVACDAAWGAAEKAVKAAIFYEAGVSDLPDRDYKHHNLPRLYGKVTDEDSLGVLESVQEFRNYDEYVRYPKLEEKGEIKMPADKYTEAKAEKALVSAGLILDAARAYVVN